MKTPVYVNARFLAEPLTGVQRYGREVLAQLDAMLDEGEIDPGRYEFVLLLPVLPEEDPGYRHLQLRRAGRLRSHLWEQLSLPRHAPGFLLNLKNTAPVRHPRTGVVIHDLQVFARPDTHTGVFGTLYRRILPRAARRARALLVPSESTAREIEKYFGVPAGRCVVTSEGHEHVLRGEPALEVLERHGITPGSYLLAVSSMNPNKNFRAVLEALARLGADLPFVVAGGANPKVFAESNQSSLPPGAIHVGRVSDAELRALYENAMVFVFPSYYEGFGLPPLEAMALGCPVISSPTTSLPEVGGDAVLYADPADPGALAQQIQRLAGDERLRDELRVKGRQRAAGFTWRAAARRIWRAIEPHLAP